MAEIRQTHQLRLVVYPIIYRVSAPSQVVVWDFSHQQYEGVELHVTDLFLSSRWLILYNEFYMYGFERVVVSFFADHDQNVQWQL